MTKLLSLIAFCFLALPLFTQTPSTLITSLPQAKDYVQKRVSSYDRSGRKCGCAEHRAGGDAHAARRSWAGVISHVWVTIASDDPNHLKALVLRMYWDGEGTPSVEAPIGDFFGLGLGDYHLYQSHPLSVGSDKALNCFFPMPFQKHARITVTNEGSAKNRRVLFQYRLSGVQQSLCRRIYFTSTRSTGRPRRRGGGPISGSPTATRSSMTRRI